MHRNRHVSAIVLFYGLFPAGAFAGGVGVETIVPVDIGAVAEVDLPWRLALAFHVGFVPPTYVDAITAVVDDPAATEILNQNLQSALTLGAELRGRLWRGLWLGTGFRWFGLQGGLVGCDVLEIALGQDLCTAEQEAAGMLHIDIASQIYALSFSLGWQFHPRPFLGFYVGASFFLGVGSTTETNARFPRTDAALKAYLDELYRTYIKIPAIGLSATYEL